MRFKFGFLLVMLMHLCYIQIHAQDHSILHQVYTNYISSKIDSTDTSNGSGKFVVPVFGHAPESGYEYGVSGFANFTLPSNKGYRVSSITAKLSVTSLHSTNLITYSDMWSRQNAVHLYSDLRSQDYPFYYYGVGNHTSENNKILIHQRLKRAEFGMERLVWGHWYAGADASWANFNFTYSSDSSLLYSRNLPRKVIDNTLSIAMVQVYDTRDNVQYTQKGILVKMNWALLPSVSTSSTHAGTNFQLNARCFQPLFHQRVVLGYDMQYASLNVKNPPFYLLPQLGNDEIMRGYYVGRFRDRKLFANQIECRYHFMPRLACVAFAGFGTTTSKNWDITQMKTSLGGGVRYFFDIVNNSTIRLDYAVGDKIKGENRQTGFYLTLGEAF